MDKNIKIDYFEGPEKLLEVWFGSSNPQQNCSLRKISDEKWDLLLQDVKCVVLHKSSNNHFDAFLLSESSLFVYDSMIILKTCGTTTLLQALPKLLEYSKEVGLDQIIDFFYSRKNFQVPENQMFPHYDFRTEISYLDKIMEQKKMNGAAYVIGRLNGDHWNLYTVAQPKGPPSPDQTLEILMNDLDPEIMKNFYCENKENAPQEVKAISQRTGINDLLPGAIVDDFLFHPCGYSANGLLDKAYWTIHVTPQPEFSYVSFETNYVFDNYEEIVDKVLKVFKPGRFILSLFANKHAKCDILPIPKSYIKASHAEYDFDAYRLQLNHFIAPKNDNSN